MGIFADRIGQFAPPWFLGPTGTNLLRAVGLTLDDFRLRVREGMRAALPYAGPGGAPLDDGTRRECDLEALPWHARDRGIRLYDTEPVLSRRVRLSQWRQLKKRRGSHLGQLNNVQPFWYATETSTLPVMRIVHQSNEVTPSATWHTLSAKGAYSVHQEAPSNWDYDGQPTKRSRYWAIIHLPPGYGSRSSAVYDGSDPYDGSALYDGITTMAIRDLVDAFKEAKAAHSRLAALIVTTLQPTDAIPGGVGKPFDPFGVAEVLPDGSTSLPTGNWGSAVDPVTNLPTRPPWASFVYEDNP
jgi:hypothetical protein